VPCDWVTKPSYVAILIVSPKRIVLLCW